MSSPVGSSRYDVVIAGARCAGSATALLLARRGLRVLAVDPARYGSDTLSTHALMRGAVLQLHRWGLLGAVRASGTPAIRKTSFHYGPETIVVPIKDRDGVDSLVAPRRTVLDALLADAAHEAGAEVVHGLSVVDLLRDADGRVRGAKIAGADRETFDVTADLVIGADGIHSRVARLVGAGRTTRPHTPRRRSTAIGGTSPSPTTTGSTSSAPASAPSPPTTARRASSRSRRRRASTGGPTGSRDSTARR